MKICTHQSTLFPKGTMSAPFARDESPCSTVGQWRQKASDSAAIALCSRSGIVGGGQASKMVICLSHSTIWHWRSRKRRLMHRPVFGTVH